MTNLRKGTAVAVAILALLSLAGVARAQHYYTPYRYTDVVPGHHFYQKSGYVSVPPLSTPIPVGGVTMTLPVGASTQGTPPYSGSVSGFPGGGGYRGSVSGIPGGGGYSGSVFGLYNYYPIGGSYNYYSYGLYNPYWWSLYNLSGYGLGNYVSPLGSYAWPYTILPSDYAPRTQGMGYYRSPLIYEGW
jgi:hypothetical protein